MPLTHDEMVELDAMLRKMEKGSTGWRASPWGGLVAGASCFALGTWQFIWQFARASQAAQPREPWAAATGLDVYVASISTFMGCLTCVMGMFLMGSGVWTFVTSWVRWRNRRRDVLLVKLARSWMESQARRQSS